MASKSGVISASLIIVILVAAAVGTIVALVLQETGLGSRPIALISGFIATVVASIARYKVIFLGAEKGPDEARIPTVVLTYAAVASIAGSLAAHDLNRVLDVPSVVFLGTLAGLLSAVLMAMLMITYHMNPHPPRV